MISQNAAVLMCLLVAATQHCVASGGAQVEGDGNEEKPVTSMDEEHDDPTRCSNEMHTFVREIEENKKLTINTIEYKLIDVISRGNVEKPIHMVLQTVPEKKKKNYFSKKPKKGKYYSARLYPASMSSVADYEAAITEQLNDRKKVRSDVFPVFVAKESYSCFTVLLTDLIGEDLEKRDGNQWRNDPVRGASPYRDLMDSMVKALGVLYTRNITHNNISPSSLSCHFEKAMPTFTLANFREHSAPKRLFSPWTDCHIKINMTDPWYAGLTLLTIGLYNKTESVQCKGKIYDPCSKGDMFFVDQKEMLQSKFHEEKKRKHTYLETYVDDIKILMCTQKDFIKQALHSLTIEYSDYNIT